MIKLKEQKSIFHILGCLYAVLSFRRRCRLIIILISMCISGIAELLSIGAVIPFLLALTNPQFLWQNKYILTVTSLLTINNDKQLLLLVTATFVLAAGSSTIIRISSNWASGKFAADIGTDISKYIYTIILHKEYQYHLDVNSGFLLTAVTTSVFKTVEAIKAFLSLASGLILSLFILAALALANSIVAIASLLVFGAFFLFVARICSSRLARNSDLIAYETTASIKSVQRGLGSVIDIILDGTQGFFVSDFVKHDKLQRRLSAQNDFIVSFPRFALEGLATAFIAFLGFLLFIYYGNGADAITYLGIFALGGQRLLPSLQQMYRGWAVIKSSYADLLIVISLLGDNLNAAVQPACLTGQFSFSNKIEVHNACFGYSETRGNVLNSVNLSIAKGEKIGIVGKSGSGKSTLVNILMGLLQPDSGTVFVDNIDIYNSEQCKIASKWRTTVAHVPQVVYLTDETLAQNIAFGIPIESIDWPRLYASAHKACISQYIESLPQAYSTNVGERGVKLSGGQRQRIGIARALYKKAQVLVLDEATSSLDSFTEDLIMQEIQNLDSDLTVLIIAHRLNTLSFCDRIITI